MPRLIAAAPPRHAQEQVCQCSVTVTTSGCQWPCLHGSERTAVAPRQPAAEPLPAAADKGLLTRSFVAEPPLFRAAALLTPASGSFARPHSTEALRRLLLRRLLAGAEGWIDSLRSDRKRGGLFSNKERGMTRQGETRCLYIVMRQSQSLLCSQWLDDEVDSNLRRVCAT